MVVCSLFTAPRSSAATSRSTRKSTKLIARPLHQPDRGYPCHSTLDRSTRRGPDRVVPRGVNHQPRRHHCERGLTELRARARRQHVKVSPEGRAPTRHFFPLRSTRRTATMTSWPSVSPLSDSDRSFAWSCSGVARRGPKTSSCWSCAKSSTSSTVRCRAQGSTP
jgi:hypothetical protein